MNESFDWSMLPQGGWGWLVVGAAFLVQVLTTGLQFAFGVMATQVHQHFRRDSTVEIGQFHLFHLLPFRACFSCSFLGNHPVKRKGTNSRRRPIESLVVSGAERGHTSCPLLV